MSRHEESKVIKAIYFQDMNILDITYKTMRTPRAIDFKIAAISTHEPKNPIFSTIALPFQTMRSWTSRLLRGHEGWIGRWGVRHHDMRTRWVGHLLPFLIGEESLIEPSLREATYEM